MKKITHHFISSNIKLTIIVLFLIGILGCLLTVIVPFFFIMKPFVNGPVHFINGVINLLRDAVYIEVLKNTFLVILYVSIFCIIVGLPIAVFLWKTTKTNKLIVVGILLIPLLMNQIARNYAWVQILDNDGLINKIVLSLHLFHSPLHLIYNRFGVSLVLAQGFIPIFILNVYVSLAALPRIFEEASFMCGANKISTFFRIILPNIYQGIIGGLSLVAILSFGYFITPAMLGGSGGITLPKLLYDEFNTYGGEFTSALQSFMILLIIIPLLFFTMRHILNLNR